MKAKRANHRKPTRSVTGSGNLRVGYARIATRSSLVGLKIYPPADPPRKIPRTAFTALIR